MQEGDISTYFLRNKGRLKEREEWRETGRMRRDAPHLSLHSKATAVQRHPLCDTASHTTAICEGKEVAKQVVDTCGEVHPWLY